MRETKEMEREKDWAEGNIVVFLLDTVSAPSLF